MPRVFLALLPSRSYPGIQDLEAQGIEIHQAPVNRLAPPEHLIQLLRGCNASLAGAEAYPRQVLEALPELRHVARIGVGYDAVDIDAATELGVVVSNTPGGNDFAVADHAFGLMIALAHGIQRADRNVRNQVWLRGGEGYDLFESTIGIVGLGRIGKGVARRAKGFSMRILAAEPAPDMDFVREFGVELVPHDELYATADFVTIHTPLDASTRNLMGPAQFALLKPTAIFVNTARGGLVDEDALYAALKEGRIAGAGIDVRQVEPAQDWRFNEFDNVIQTTHSAPATQKASRKSVNLAAENVLAVLRGEVPAGILNPEVWERRR